MNSTKQRNPTFDLAKGILIFLVVLGHALQYGFGQEYNLQRLYSADVMFMTIYSFHMPAFMIISGYLFFYSDRRSFRDVLVSKFKSIGIPFIVFCTMIYGLELYYSRPSFNEAVHGYLSQFRYNMWFLSSILVNALLVAIVNRIWQGHKLPSLLTLLGISVLLVIIPFPSIISSHKFMLPCFIWGYYLHAYGVELYHRFDSRMILGVLTLVFIACVAVFSKDMLVYVTGVCVFQDGVFSGYQLYLDLARWGIGIYATFWFLCMVARMGSGQNVVHTTLTRWGKESLGIYGLQSVFYVLISHSQLFNSIPYNPITPLLLAFAITLLCDGLLQLAAKNKVLRILILGGRG